MEQQEVKTIFKQYYKNDDSLEQVIQELKDAGASQMQCTRALITELKLSLPEADNIVINSDAWKENLEDVNRLRENLYNEAKNLNED